MNDVFCVLVYVLTGRCSNWHLSFDSRNDFKAFGYRNLLHAIQPFQIKEFFFAFIHGKFIFVFSFPFSLDFNGIAISMACGWNAWRNSISKNRCNSTTHHRKSIQFQIDSIRIVRSVYIFFLFLLLFIRFRNCETLE